MSKTVIHSVQLFDGESVHENATVVFDIASGTITEVTTSAQKASSSNDNTVIDGSGHTLIPGLIDAHIHCYDIHLPHGTGNSGVLGSTLKSGVTTVCDMHGDYENVNGLRQIVAQELEHARKAGPNGRVTMADVKSSLLAATIEGGWPKPIVLASHPGSKEIEERVSKWPNLTPATIPTYISSHRADGANYIKLMQEDCCAMALPTGSVPTAPVSLQREIVIAAHEAGFPVVGHALSVDNTLTLLSAGVDGLTHTFVDQPPTAEVLETYKSTNAFVIPTLTVLSSLTAEEPSIREKFSAIAESKHLLDETFITKSNMLASMGMGSRDPPAKIEYAYDTIRQLQSQGIDIVAGTDSAAGLKGTAIGPSLWMELQLYVERCGMTVEQTLRAATGNASRRFGFEDRGRVEVGRRADLVLVKGNLMQDLGALWAGGEGSGLVGVWKEGIRAV